MLFKCQALTVGDRDVAMCAWADSGVRALVTVSGYDLPAADKASICGTSADGPRI